MDPAAQPFDVELGVRLAEAASQAMWGSAHYCVMMEPIQVKVDHITMLGKQHAAQCPKLHTTGFTRAEYLPHRHVWTASLPTSQP